ncbi:DUF927 domain-containing protein [Halodurantibacterium flavum]|uniref:DUF927 domain-containing protein n=1 Tax=Halodurantibacterium flavum TaxID=1382802 RepID=A0ABW4S403_9RHOB
MTHHVAPSVPAASARALCELSSSTAVDDPNDHLPAGYYMRKDGIYISDNADEDAVWLCSPLRLVGDARTPEGSKWSLILQLLDRDRRWKLHVIPKELFGGPASKFIAPLLGAGLDLAPGSSARKHLAALLQIWRNETLLLLVDKPGWSDREFTTFVLPDGTPIGTQDVIFTKDVTAPAASSAGSIDDWRNNVGALGVGNRLLVTAVSVALAGPLIEMLGEESVGLHFRGVSSSGKTTLIRAGASVWGPPAGTGGWNATKNGLEAAAAAASGTVLVIDEIAEAPTNELGDLLYLLGNGRGKMRMEVSGSRATSASWRLGILSAGEVSVAEHMRIAGRHAKAGHEMRLLDVVADDRLYRAFDDLHGSGAPAEFVDRLQRGYSSSYGTAGPAFVRFLIENRHNVAKYRSMIERISVAGADSYSVAAGDGQAQRALRRFALVALAGYLATGAGITGWTPACALRAALETFGAWHERHKQQPSRSEPDWMAITRSFVEAATAGLEEAQVGVAAPVPCSFGWLDDDYFYVTREVWQRHHTKPEEAARRLDAHGLLKTNGGGGLQFRMPRSIPRRPWVYAVSVRILDEVGVAAGPFAVVAGSKAA